MTGTATTMAKRGRSSGRPTKDDGPAGTKLIRVFADVAEMISWITELDDVKTANYLDPLIRSSVILRYKQLEPQVEAIKRARAEAAANRPQK